MIRLFLIVPFLFLLSMSAKAEVIRYSPEARFAVINEDKEGDINVVMREEDYSDLPDFIKNQIYFVANNCTEDVKNASLIKAYSYVSENTRSKKLPPNYILDLSPLSEVKLMPCSFQKVCTEGQCSLWGFRATGQNTWIRGFALPLQSWSIKTKAMPLNDQQVQTLIAVKFETGRCEILGGQYVDDDICEVDYAWSGNGVSAIRKVLPSAPAE